MIDYLENTISDEQLVEMVVDKHRFKDEGKTFHIGIIDYLQEYNTFKSFERCSKILYYRKSEQAISVATPDVYGKRFTKFMEEEVFNE